MGMPMSVLKAEGIFEKVIAIKYDVPNDRLDMFDQYMKDIDTFYGDFQAGTDVGVRRPLISYTKEDCDPSIVF